MPFRPCPSGYMWYLSSSDRPDRCLHCLVCAHTKTAFLDVMLSLQEHALWDVAVVALIRLQEAESILSWLLSWFFYSIFGYEALAVSTEGDLRVTMRELPAGQFPTRFSFLSTLSPPSQVSRWVWRYGPGRSWFLIQGSRGTWSVSCSIGGQDYAFWRRWFVCAAAFGCDSTVCSWRLVGSCAFPGSHEHWACVVTLTWALMAGRLVPGFRAWLCAHSASVAFFPKLHEKISKSWKIPFNAKSHFACSPVLTTLDGGVAQG